MLKTIKNKLLHITIALSVLLLTSCSASFTYNNLTWSVNLQKNIFFIKDITIFREKMIEKNNLYKLYEAGLVKILDDSYN